MLVILKPKIFKILISSLISCSDQCNVRSLEGSHHFMSPRNPNAGSRNLSRMCDKAVCLTVACLRGMRLTSSNMMAETMQRLQHLMISIRGMYILFVKVFMTEAFQMKIARAFFKQTIGASSINGCGLC